MTRAQRERQRASSILLPKKGESFRIEEPNRECPRISIYARLSMETKTSVSMDRQLEVLEEVVRTKLNGKYDPEVDYYEDYDLSAKGDVFRPGMEELLGKVKERQYDGVVIWEFSRAFRNTRESSIAINIMSTHSCELYSHLEPHLTLFGPMKYAIEFAADQAQKEIEKTSARVVAAHEYLAKFGATMSAPVFGMELFEVPSPVPRRKEPIKRLRPDETPCARYAGHSPAGLVREAAARVVAGESMRQVILDWTDRGIKGVKAESWSIPAMAGVLRNPRVAGYATFRGELVRDDMGVPLQLHEPVLDQQTWELLKSRLSNGMKKRRAATDSLLRGLLRCGRCGSGMMFMRNKWGGSYACWRTAAATSGCTGNAVSAPRTDELIEAQTAELLAHPALLEPIVGSLRPEEVDETPILNTIAGLQQALNRQDLEKAKGAYEDHDGERRYAAVKASLLAELDKAREAHRRLTMHAQRALPPALAPDGSNIIPALTGLSRQEKRTVLLELIDEIVIRPVDRDWRPRKGKRFDESRVRVSWRTTESTAA